MSKIKELIDIKSGYSSYVDLNEEFYYYNEDENSKRLKLYQPIKAHRDAFEEVANALNPKDKRFYFLSGSYGTGKSHLCLMLGNYFLNKSSMPEIKTFFDNYENAQEDVKLKPEETLDEVPASTLRNKRKEGRNLVAICRFDTTDIDFQSTILRAIQEALEIDEAEVKLDTHYKEALRKLKDWEDRQQESRFYNDFRRHYKQMETNWSYQKLIKKLENNNSEALKIFKKCFKKTTDTEFTYSKDNLLDIIKDMLQDKSFKNAYEGIVIIYDELGYALEEPTFNLSFLHEFAQFCAKSKLNYLSPCIFIGTGHKMFANHGKVGDKIHWETLQERVNEIPIQTEGMENIIGAIVQQKNQSELWQKKVEPKTDIFSMFPKECKRLNIFSWLKAPVLKQDIIENIYPMHPLATYSLLQLAKELGSDNRSVFKFFAPDFDLENNSWKNVQKFSYPWFIDNHNIFKKGKLNLYTSDLLVDYFLQDYFDRGEDAIAKSLRDRIKKSINNYLATRESLNKYLQSESEVKLFEETDELMESILKVMLVNELVSKEKAPIINTEENIAFALNAISDTEKGKIKQRLSDLNEVGVIYKNDDGVYEFKPSDAKDVRRMVNEYISKPEHQPSDILEKFLHFVPNGNDKFLEAKEYNNRYNEDKRLKIKFRKPEMLKRTLKYQGENINIFEKFERERQEKDIVEGYEGTAIYVFCNDEGEIEKAKGLLTNNNSNRIAVGVPKKSFPVSQQISQLLAVSAIKDHYSDEFGHLEKSQLNKIEKTAKEELKDIYQKYFDNTNMKWFTKNGEKIDVKDNDKYDVANYIMQKIFDEKRNKIAHSYFNKIHSKLTRVNKRTVQEASEELIDITQPIVFEWNRGRNTGARRYLQNVFAENQLIKHIKTEGDKRVYEVERKTSNFKKIIPAYFRMLKKLEAQEDQGAKSCNSFFNEFFEDYGQGYTSMILLTLLARRYFRDSIRFKKDKDDLKDIEIESYQDVKKILDGSYTNAVLITESISQEEERYFSDICKIFSKEEIAEGKDYGIRSAYHSIVKWWKDLPPISKSKDFYNDSDKKTVGLFNRYETTDPYVFIKNEIPENFGIDRNEKLTKQSVSSILDKLKQFKQKSESILDHVKERIRGEYSKIFNSEDTLDIDIQNAIKKWYKDLDSYQQDPHSHDRNEIRALISKISELSNIQKLIYEILPEIFNYKKVKNWRNDLTEDYIQKIKDAKQHIEDTESPVEEVKLKYENHDKIEGDKVYYSGNLQIIPKCDNKSIDIFYTLNNQNPTKKTSDRKQIKVEEKLSIDSGNKTLKIVSADHEGNYGKMKNINIIDNTRKYRISTDKQKGVFDQDITFNSVFPKDKSSTEVSIRSYVDEIIKNSIVNKETLKNILHNIIKDLEQ